ncbi:MAG: alpha/beta hydrolase, partial [Polyangiales bacterium]
RGSGPVVLCLHGVPDSARSFRSQLAGLDGYRVIAPMMRGYEPSSQPRDDDYGVHTLALDVLAWLDELGGEPCHLVGHDWGAIVAHVVALLAPERLASLTTIAVPHPGRLARELLRKRPSQLLLSWYILFFQLRGVADSIVERDDWAFLDMLWRRWSPSYRLPPDERQALKSVFAQPGVQRAALGYYRALPRTFTQPSFRRLLAQRVPVRTLAITGAEDGCMDTRLYDDLLHPRDFPAGLHVERIHGAGHFVHMERPDLVNALLRAHFEQG